MAVRLKTEKPGSGDVLIYSVFSSICFYDPVFQNFNVSINL